jgi:hypothetical protein
MSSAEHRLIVIQGLALLRGQGYEYDEEQVEQWVEFGKEIVDWVRCVMRFNFVEYPHPYHGSAADRRCRCFPGSGPTYAPRPTLYPPRQAPESGL